MKPFGLGRAHRSSLLGANAAASDASSASEAAAPSDAAPADATRYERARDATVAFVARREFTVFGLLLIPFVLGFGGMWFFMVIGLHFLTEEQAHFWENASIQVLTVCMVYPAIISFPYRAANAVHLWASHRSSAPGLDFYGRPTEVIWFHVSRGHRSAITVLLLGNCFSQYVNRTARCIYYDYESSHRMPGQFWAMAFLLLAFTLQGIAAAYKGALEGKLRKAHPGRFAPAPLERLRRMMAERKAQAARAPSTAATTTTSAATTTRSFMGSSRFAVAKPMV